MRSLEAFQKEVLQPLREIRNDAFKQLNYKMASAYEAFAAVQSVHDDEEKEFYVEQAKRKVEFEAEQRKRLQGFVSYIRSCRIGANIELQKALADIKNKRRQAYESCNDAIGAAFANFNDERKKAGELPVTYDEIKKLIKEEGGEE